jgi:hypothetical protein
LTDALKGDDATKRISPFVKLPPVVAVAQSYRLAVSTSLLLICSGDIAIAAQTELVKKLPLLL